jgi:flagellar hook-basal body complex protein FliE
MAIGPISSIGSGAGVAGVGGVGGVGASGRASGAGSASGFADALTKGIQNVANLDANADQLIADFAAGGTTDISDVMAASSKASLGVQVMVELRNRALEAYQQVMNVQV